MDGFTVRLYDDSWNVLGEQETPETSEVGQFKFTGLFNEDTVYRVCGVQKTGFNQSPAALGQHVVDVNNNTPSGYADAVVVENNSVATDEFNACWETTLSDNSAGYLNVGYTYANPSTPEMLGFNQQGSTSLTDVPPFLACGVAVNGSKKSSATWTDVSASATNVKYLRHNQRPGGLNDIILGQTDRVTLANPSDADNTSILGTLTDDYDTFYAGWGSFGGNEGLYKTRVRAYSDLNSNDRFDDGEPISDWSNFCEVTYDKTAPSTTLSSPIDGFATNDEITITGETTDATGVAEVNLYYRETGTTTWLPLITLPNGAADSPFAFSHGWTPSEGTYDIKAAGTDVAGNVESSAYVYGVTYDVTAPDAPSLVEPTNNSVVNGATLLSDWSTVPDADHYIYESYHNEAATNLRFRDEYTDSQKSATNVGNATFWWRVKAVDAAGNESGWSPLWKVTIDNDAPDVSVSSPVTGFVSGTVDVIGTVTDANPHHYWFVIQNSSNSTVAGPGTVNSTSSFTDQTLLSWDTTSVPDGVYTIKLEARDSANNKDTGSVAWVEVTVDNTEPTSEISTYDLPDGGEKMTATFSGLIEGTANDGTGSGIDHVLLSISYLDFGDDESETVYLDATASAWTDTPSLFRADDTDSWSYQILEDLVKEGIYTVTSHAVDVMGNVESTYTIKIIYDKTIPEVTLTIDPASPDGDNGWYRFTEPTITLDDTDNYEVGHIEYQWNTTNDGDWIMYTGPFNPPSEGQNILYYRGIDKVGNVMTDLGVKDVKYDSTNPAGEPLNVKVENITADDADGLWEAPTDDSDVSYYKLEWKHEDGTSHGDTVSRTTFEHKLDELKDGLWTFSVKAMDAAGNFTEKKVEFRVGPGPSSGTSGDGGVLGTTTTNEVTEAGTGGLIGQVFGATNQQTQEDAQEQTEETQQSESAESEDGTVLGVSDCAPWLYYLPLILLALQLLSILGFELIRREPSILKLLFAGAVTLGVIALHYFVSDDSCYIEGSWFAMITAWFAGISLAVGVVSKLLAYGYVEEA